MPKVLDYNTERNVAEGVLTAYAALMENKPTPPPRIPMLPMNAPTLAANVAMIEFISGNGGIQLFIGDQRYAPKQNIDEPLREATFETGRFMLTPRALRQLLDGATAAVQKYEETTGKPLPTIDQFIAGRAMEGLLKPQPPQEPRDENP